MPLITYMYSSNLERHKVVGKKNPPKMLQFFWHTLTPPHPLEHFAQIKNFSKGIQQCQTFKSAPSTPPLYHFAQMYRSLKKVLKKLLGMG